MRHKIKNFHLPPLQKKITMYNNKCSRYQIEVTRPKQPKWGFSSAGRAPALHAGGQEFESPNLHHLIQVVSTKLEPSGLFFNCFLSGILT